MKLAHSTKQKKKVETQGEGKSLKNRKTQTHIHVKQQFHRMPFMPMFNQCPYLTKERSLPFVQGNGPSLVYWYATRQKSLLDISPIS